MRPRTPIPLEKAVLSCSQGGQTVRMPSGRSAPTRYTADFSKRIRHAVTECSCAPAVRRIVEYRLCRRQVRPALCRTADLPALALRADSAADDRFRAAHAGALATRATAGFPHRRFGN